MKKIVLLLALILVAAAPAFAATDAEVREAENGPGVASKFTPCPEVRPSGPQAKVPGKVVWTPGASHGGYVQHGSSFSAEEAYDFYCKQGGGKK